LREFIEQVHSALPDPQLDGDMGREGVEGQEISDKILMVFIQWPDSLTKY